MKLLCSPELLDLYSHHLIREFANAKPRFASFDSLLTYPAVGFFDFEFDSFYHNSDHVDLLSTYFPRHHLHHHHRHHHQDNFLPLQLLPANFFDAAADLTFRVRKEAEAFVWGFSNLLVSFELVFGRDLRNCIGADLRKLKRAAEIMMSANEGFDRKGCFEKTTRGAVECEVKGKYNPLSWMYTFQAASAPKQGVCESTEKETKMKRVMAQSVKIGERIEHPVISRRQKALAKRSAHKSNGKQNELSLQDAAMVIQKAFRDHMLRHSQTFQALRDLAVARSKLKAIRSLLSKFSYRYQISNDAEEHQRFSERIITLLLAVEATEGHDHMVRSAKRSMAQELEAMLEVVDPHPSHKLWSRRQKNDLDGASLPNELASGVADVIRMLNEEVSGGTNLIDLSL